MLPCLSTLHIGAPNPANPHNPLRPTDLPDAVLGLTIKNTGKNVRTLCAAASALSQTDEAGRDMTAWKDLAAQYEMPGWKDLGKPYEMAKKAVPPQIWRSFVFSWCAKIQPESYFKALTQAANWKNQDYASFEWIIDMIFLSDPPVEKWTQEKYTKLVKTILMNTRGYVAIRFMDKIWGFIGAVHYKPYEMYGEWFSYCLFYNDIPLTSWMLKGLIDKVDGEVLELRAQAQTPEIGRKLKALVDGRDSIMVAAYTHDKLGNTVEMYGAMLEALEAVAKPSRELMGDMLQQAFGSSRIDYMKFLNKRYSYKPGDLTWVPYLEPDVDNPAFLLLYQWRNRTQ